jgi:hypothetical protein
MLELLEDRLTPSSGVHGVICGSPLNFTSFYDGGPLLNTASGPIQVDLVFWGTAFANSSQSEAPFITAVQNLLNSPFLGALSQYGQVSHQTLPDKAGDVVLAGTQTVNSDPGRFNSTDNAFDFNDTDVQHMLDANVGGVIPSPPPRANGFPPSNFLYLVIPESNSEDTSDGAFGIHGMDPANPSRFYYGWTINDGTIPTAISTLSHELVESITDPDGSGPPHTSGFTLVAPIFEAGYELSDGLGQYFLANVNGVDVQSYFSQADKSYIIPTGGQENIYYSTKGVLTVLGGQLGLPTDNITISLGSTGGIQVQENGDTFLFDSTATVVADAGVPITSVVVNGGTGNTNLTLDFSNGNFVPANGSLTFKGGTGGHNTLHVTGTGAGVTNTWKLSGVNSGTFSGHVAFSNVANLVGDTTSADNVFKFIGTGRLTGTIMGGGSTGNWLDFSSATGPVKVNLSAATSMSVPADSATRVNAGLANGFSNIQNVLGSATGRDTLIGSALGSVLVGHGTGNTLVSTGDPSILIGGSGANTLIGGTHDLLIYGRTIFDHSIAGMPATFNIASLSAILAELQGTTRPFTRANLNAIRSNALLPLQVGQTVFLSTTPGAFQVKHVTAPGDDWIFTAFAASFPATSSANFFN